MKGTIPGGALREIENCYIEIPSYGRLTLKSLPDISDSKSATYNDEVVIGRSSPIKTYAHSDNRTISMTLHLFVTEEEDWYTNIKILRAVESAVYPRDEKGISFIPPPICKIKCGALLSDNDLCVILKSYSVKFPTDVVWHDDLYTPMKFDIDTQWDVVYNSADLPGQERIMNLGG